MKKSIKVFIAFITSLVLITVVNVNAATGYTYDHNGDPIYSTVGLVSTQPKRATDLGIADSSLFASPEDLFVYTDKDGVSTIYIIDSGSNTVFVFNSNYELINTFNSAKVNANAFDDGELAAIKSGGKAVIVAQDPTNPRYISLPLSTFTLVQESTTDTPPVVISAESTEFTYTLFGDYDGYKMVWESSNPAIAEYRFEDNKHFIDSKAIGSTTIVGKLINITADPANLSEEDILDEAQITVNVVTEKSKTPAPLPKADSFIINELRTIGEFDLRFNGINGIYRAEIPTTGEDYLYIADRSNNQIVVLDSITLEVVKFVTRPDDIAFEGKAFEPKEIVTDRTGRIYVIANNIYDGILQFSREGKFDRFTGVNYVKLTPWEIFWRNFSTDEQLAKQTTIINTSFTGMTVDKDGFIYATSYALTNDKDLVTDDKNMIKKINTFGKDVLRRNGYQPPMGDVEYIATSNEALIRGPSRLTGVAVNDYGVYTSLDIKMGKLFTYDREGNLLYISGESYISGGGNASQINTLSNPVAIAYLGEDILVLDKNQRSLIVYEPTLVGELINQAVKFEYVGDNISAAEIWEEVVVQNANYEYAYIGIGKKYLALEEYELAMENFKIGQDRELYSRAFKMERDKAERKAFAPVMGLIVFLVIAGWVYGFIKRRRNPKQYESGAGDE